MDRDRETFHSMLTGFLGTGNVYFQPPESVKLVYPCIVYERKDAETLYSNGVCYAYMQIYDVTIIDKDPDSGLPKRFAEEIPCAAFDRHFTNGNLHHDVFVVTQIYKESNEHD